MGGGGMGRGVWLCRVCGLCCFIIHSTAHFLLIKSADKVLLAGEFSLKKQPAGGSQLTAAGK